MRCYICNTAVDNNSLTDLEDREYDQVVEYHGLIRCDGPDENFDEDDNVVICPACVNAALTH